MKKFFPELRRRIRLLFFGLPVPDVAPAPAPHLPGPKPGRPISAALSRTLDALKRQPAITPAELASVLSVSPSYARTLLRRARARQPEPVQSFRSIPPDVERTVHELSARLTETENHLAALKAAPLHSRTSMHLNRRAEVLRLAEAGETESAIAARMAIPTGEVAFILKVDRLLANAANSR
jgi:hypothetical protein